MGSKNSIKAKLTIIIIKETFVVFTVSASLELIWTLGSILFGLVIYMNLQIFIPFHSN